MEPPIGLVLTGGGARAAYQVGALRALVDIAGDCCPFRVIAGVSAGAINGAAVAIAADGFAVGMARLESVWRALTPDRVYRTDVPNLAEIAAGWLRQLAGGGCLGPADVNALLDTTPLRALLTGALAMARIRGHVAAGRLRGVAVTATSYRTGNAIAFFDAVEGVRPWLRTGRLGRRAELTVDHVLASAAIPLFFPPVLVDAAPFGDGCIRMTAPLSPAIHLGAERILAIGIRPEEGPGESYVPRGAGVAPTPAEIGGVLLDAVFLDALESDAERLKRINGTLSLMTAEGRAQLAQPLRSVPLLVLRPSVDLGRLAIEQYDRLPWALRYLLRGIGADDRRGWELISYLAFEPTYVGRLIDLGHRDTLARRDEIAAFLAGDERARAVAQRMHR